MSVARTNAPTEKPPRRRFQFRLRTLFIVTTLLAVLLSLLSGPFTRWRRERPAVVRIGELGGQTQYEFEAAPGSSVFSSILGSDIYLRAKVVLLDNTPVKDDDLELLTRLEQLKSLSLRRTQITDAGLAHLGKLAGLEAFNLADTPITDEGLTHLAGLENLRSLDLSGTLVTDAGLESLTGLQQLAEVNLAGTGVTYAAIEQLQNALPNADNLAAQRAVAEIIRAGGSAWPHNVPPEEIANVRCSNRVADADLAHLAHLPGLRQLRIDRWQTTDATLAAIAGLKGLRDLNLRGSQVTTEGLKHLAALVNLEVLDLTDTGTNDEGLRQVGSLAGLKRLSLAGTQVTGEGFVCLKDLSDLEALDLGRVAWIYDMDLVHLKGLTALSELNLSHARLSGPGLEHLHGLTALRRVTIPKDGIEPAAIASLRTALPTLDIEPHVGNTIQRLAVGTPVWNKVPKPIETAFWAGDYASLAGMLPLPTDQPESPWTEYLWLGHAYRLAGNVPRAVENYHKAMAVFLRQLADPTAKIDERQWPKLVLFTGLLELYGLNDPAAAVKTLSQGTRLLPEAGRPISELAAETAEALAVVSGPYASRPGDPQAGSNAMYPMATMRHLAKAYERQGNDAAALECWIRLRLSFLRHRTPMVLTDPIHIARLWANSTDEGPPAMPVFAVVSADSPDVTIKPDEGESRLRWWGNNSWNAFGLVATPGKALSRLEVTCQVECKGENSPGRLYCWTDGKHAHGPGSRKLLDHRWGDDRPAGTYEDEFSIDVPHDADVVFFQLPGRQHRQEVTQLTVKGTLRDRKECQETVSDAAVPNGKLMTRDKPPFEGMSVELPGFERTGLDSASLAKLPDGRWLMAFEAPALNYHHRMMLTTSEDLIHWQPPWEFEHNGICDTRSPSLVVDDEGTIWLLSVAKRLDLDQFSTGYYLLWLTHSRDGREWSLPVPVKTAGPLGNHSTARLSQARDGKYWIFYGPQAASGDSPGEIKRLTPLNLLIRHGGLTANHSHAAFDAAGRCHMVFDDFGRKIYYCHSDDMRIWSPLVELAEKAPASSVKFPRLLLADDRVALIYSTNDGGWLRRGALSPEGASFGEALHFTDSRIGIEGPSMVVDGQQVYLPAGGSTPWMLRGKLEEVLSLGAMKP